MGLFINTNIGAMNARRHLNKSSGALSTAFERLSSGLRVNSAKDDAAGLAIASRFTSQIRGLNQAVRNSNDGISFAQTVEGALDESGNILQRLRELSVQAANDINTDSDRRSIQDEVDQLVDELDRIGNTTTFNNQNVLNGDWVQNFFHVGANARETVGVTVRDARATALGRSAIATSGAVSNVAIAADTLSINNVTIRATAITDDLVSTSLNTASAIAKAAAINDSTEFNNVTARAEANVVTSTLDVAGGTLDSVNNIVINGETITGTTIGANDADNTLIEQINQVSGNTGVVASLDQDHRLVLTAIDGRNIEIETNGTGAAITGISGASVGVNLSTLVLDSREQFDISGAANVPEVIGYTGNQLVGVNSTNSVSTMSVLSRDGANNAIDILDRAIEEVSEDRALLGAVQNRLESTINNLSNISENLSASRSRILDADFATETANLSRVQILQQAGTSILAQANQTPQQALSLLG